MLVKENLLEPGIADRNHGSIPRLAEACQSPLGSWKPHVATQGPLHPASCASGFLTSSMRLWGIEELQEAVGMPQAAGFFFELLTGSISHGAWSKSCRAGAWQPRSRCPGSSPWWWGGSWVVPWHRGRWCLQED